MNKKMFFGIFLILIVLMLACNNNIDNSVAHPDDPIESEIETDYKDRIIKIGTIHAPPFELIDNGQYKGPGIEVVVAVLEHLGYEYQINDYPWVRNIEMMKSGENDMLVDAFITPERREFLIYSEIPYGILPQVFFVLKDSDIEFNGDFKSLSKYTIGITRGYSYGHDFDLAMKNSIINPSESNSPENLYIKLLNNRVDMVADNLHSGREVLANMNSEDKVTVLKPYFDNLFSYVVFSKANDLEPLKIEYDEALKTLIEDGTVKGIFEKHGIEELFDTMLQEIE